MPAIIMTDANVNEIVNKNSIVIVDFWAPWCGPCQRFLPIFDVAADMHQNSVFAKVNITENPILVNHFGIKSVPTVIVIKDRKVIGRVTGGMSRDKLSEFVVQFK